MCRVFFFILFFISVSLQGQHFSQRKIKRIIRKIPAFEQAHIALDIKSLEASTAVAFYQGASYMTPASNTKLLTFLASVENFDSLPALYYQKQDSIMYFKASGYPLLFHPFYPDTLLASFFTQKHHFKYFPAKSVIKAQGQGWSWDDYSYYFAAERSPFPLYGNTVLAYGEAHSPQLIPKVFQNGLVQDSLAQSFYRDHKKNRFYYNPKKWNAQDSLYRPYITSDSLFIRMLQDEIKRPVDQIKDSLFNPSWKVLYTHQEDLLYRALLQDSDNGVAEALLNMISQDWFNEMNIEKTLDSIQSKWKPWLPDPIEWVDGSGVSRYNMVTPQTLIAVLKKIYHEIGWEKIKNYFPQGSYSGTLKNYSLDNIFAKTGTLRHNHNLSGYWMSPEGTVYVFSIMVNHFTAPSTEVRNGISLLLQQFQKKLK